MSVSFSKKQAIIRAIICCVLIGTAVAGITVGCSLINKKKPGYYELVPDSSTIYPTYSNGYHAYFYFDGSSDDITHSLNAANKIWSDTLIDSYRQYSIYVNEKTDEFTSLGYINNHLNEDIKVTEKLYNTLKKGYEFTLSSDNYSLFSEPLFEIWESIFLSDDEHRMLLDPLNNTNVNKEINDLADYINDTSNFTLEFKNDNTINFNVSKAYKDFVAGKYSFLSLNALEEAFRLEELYKAFKTAGMINGYICTDNNLFINLDEQQDVSFNTYDYGYVVNPICKISLKGMISYKEARHFLKTTSTESDNFYYVMKKDEKTYLRHLNLNIKTGIPNNYFTTSHLFLRNDSLIDSAFYSNELAFLENKDDVTSFLTKYSSKGIFLAYNTINDSKKLFISSNIDQFITLVESAGYTKEVL